MLANLHRDFVSENELRSWRTWGQAVGHNGGAEMNISDI